jgi:threonine/homoserine/homoserine lactone efflux protein
MWNCRPSLALAFSIVKYLGVRRLLTRDQGHEIAKVQRQSLRRIYSQGMLVATLNPKTALFFLATLPQFVDPIAGSVSLQLLTLGGLFVMMAIVTDSMYALLASTAGGWLKKNRSVLGAQRFVVGSVYIGLGLTAALSHHN